MAIRKIKYNDEYIYINDEVDEDDTGIMVSSQNDELVNENNEETYGDNDEE